MFGSLITLPWRMTVRGAGLAWRGASAAAGLVTGASGQRPTPDPDVDHDIDATRSEPSADAARATGEETAVESVAAEPADAGTPAARTVPAPAPAPAAEPPLSPEPAPAAEPPPAPAEPALAEPAPTGEPDPGLEGLIDPAKAEPTHISEDVELVDEVAEPGAEDGAGAQVRVEAPWQGYEAMNAGAVIDRLAGASAEELAAVELYELTHRKRQTVVDAAQAELKRRG